MKVILVGDLHINNNKQYTSNSDSYHEVFHVFDMIKERVRNDNTELLIFLGDIFDSPSNITTSSLTIVSKLFGELSKLIPIITIVGNHDDVDCKTSDIQIGEVKYSIRTTVLSFLENYPNIKVVNKPEVIRMTENVEIAFIPYSNNIEADVKLVNKKFSKGSKRILMGHFELKQPYHTIKLSQNISPNLVSAKDLANKYKYDAVYLGHIHDIGDFSTDNCVIKYLGSCRNIDFRNTGISKGIYTLNLDSLELEFYENTQTSVYKICRSYSELVEYCKSADKVLLNRTKLQYVYTNHSEIKQALKIKQFVKSIQFIKNIIGVNSSVTNDKKLQEFSRLMLNNLVNKDNLLSYAIDFKTPPNTEIASNVFKYSNRNGV